MGKINDMVRDFENAVQYECSKFRVFLQWAKRRDGIMFVTNIEYNLERPPVIRVCLFECASGELHKIVGDPVPKRVTHYTSIKDAILSSPYVM